MALVHPSELAVDFSGLDNGKWFTFGNQLQFGHLTADIGLIEVVFKPK